MTGPGRAGLPEVCFVDSINRTVCGGMGGLSLRASKWRDSASGAQKSPGNCGHRKGRRNFYRSVAETIRCTCWIPSGNGRWLRKVELTARL